MVQNVRTTLPLTGRGNIEIYNNLLIGVLLRSLFSVEFTILELRVGVHNRFFDFSTTGKIEYPLKGSQIVNRQQVKSVCFCFVVFYGCVLPTFDFLFLTNTTVFPFKSNYHDDSDHDADHIQAEDDTMERYLREIETYVFLRADHRDGMCCLLVQGGTGVRVRGDRNWSDTWTFACWPSGNPHCRLEGFLEADIRTEQ